MRHKNGWTLDSESERRRLTQNLMAATERRVSHVSFKGLTNTTFTVYFLIQLPYSPITERYSRFEVTMICTGIEAGC